MSSSIAPRGTDRLWRHLSNLEEQMTRRHGRRMIDLCSRKSASGFGDSGLESEAPVSNEEEVEKKEVKHLRLQLNHHQRTKLTTGGGLSIVERNWLNQGQAERADRSRNTRH